MMDFWDSLAVVAERRNVLRHPFYQRWSAGELSRPELAFYAGEYGHAVRALAQASRHAVAGAAPSAAVELEQHAAEEESHIALWSDFAEAVGGTPAAAQPLAETVECARVWADPERGHLDTLVALYAIESAQPAISETKRAGLAGHYGFSSGPATAYFELHAVRDLDHADAGRRWIAARLGAADTEALIDVADSVLRSNWTLLDGVQRAAAS